MRTWIAIALVGAAALWWLGPRLLFSPPMPPNLGQLDPDVQKLIRDGARQFQRSFGSAETLEQLGMAYEANGLSESARACYERVTDRDPARPKTWYRLALQLDGEGRTGEAAAAMQRAAEFDEEGYVPIYWHLGRWKLDLGDVDGAAAAFEQATVLEPSTAAGWIGRAKVHLARREPEAAIAVVKEHLYLRVPDEADHLLAIAHRQLGRPADAAAIRDRPRAGYEPRDPWRGEAGRYHVGKTNELKRIEQMLAAGRATEALPVLEKLHAERPDDVRTLGLLGIAQVECGQYAAATRTLETAVARSPNDSRQLGNLAHTHLQAHRARRGGDLTEALRLSARAVELAPQTGTFHLLRAEIFKEMESPDDAIAAYHRAFEVDGRHEGPMVAAGRLECELRRFDRAVRDFEAALSVNETSFDALMGLAYALSATGRLDAAEEALERARNAPGFDRRQHDGIAQQIQSARERQRPDASPGGSP